MRLDRALVARQMTRSRTRAHALIEAGVVRVNHAVAVRPAQPVAESDVVTVSESADHYVSRAAHKLIGALDACAPLGLDVTGRDALDAGASTGGFTQVLLERGVRTVRAVDVGHGQLDAAVAAEPRVHAVEGLNVRDLSADSPGAGVDLVVADLSFISLTLVIPALVAFSADGADLLLMVKPQFEVGRESIGRAGVVSDPRERTRAVTSVAAAMQSAGLEIHCVARSALPGPHGNVEFFVWGSRPWQARDMTGRERPPALTGPALAEAITRQTEGEQ